MVVECSFEAAPQDVYDVLADPATYPEWLVGAQHTRAIDDDFPQRGSSFDHSVGPASGVTLDDSTEGLGGQPGRHLAMLVHAGPFDARVDFDIAPGAEGTRLSFSERPVGLFAPLTPLLRPSLYARNRESMRRLGELLQAPAATR